jgi:toxin FitB
VLTVLDTKVLSELMRQRPAPAVLAWFSHQAPQTLGVSSITQAEMLLGARLLPRGQRRAQLEARLRSMFDVDFSGRIWNFDSAAAACYADIVSQRRAAGRPIAQSDAEIAAVASSRGAAVATRNASDFEGCGLVVHNPWLVTRAA